ncbi:hypothetical protein [Pelodictyon luteolum]|uniref:hypothetical protein n=1 Tax=Pelodictyon luteolum TaxID=1100 RepID=UPI0012FEC29A|nr:hypothetical protein [Pelodictyon luteolum]
MRPRHLDGQYRRRSLSLYPVGPDLPRITREGENWIKAVEAMTWRHHRLTPYHAAQGPLVEPFRRAERVELSLGTIRFALDWNLVRDIRRRYPNARVPPMPPPTHRDASA